MPSAESGYMELQEKRHLVIQSLTITMHDDDEGRAGHSLPEASVAVFHIGHTYYAEFVRSPTFSDRCPG